jgi:hypothetical protein
MGDQLQTITDSENGNAQIKDLRIGMRRFGIICAVGAAGKNDPFGIEGSDLLDADVVGIKFRIDTEVADATGNQLRVLGAKIEYENKL